MNRFARRSGDWALPSEVIVEGLGVLPATWSAPTFGALLTGGTRNGIYKPKKFHGRGCKIVNMGELFSHPRLRAVPMKRVELSESEQDRFGLKPGDLLFARRSLVAEGAGKCSLVMEVDEPTAFESSIIRARLKRDSASSSYVYYVFSAPYGRYALGTILRQVAVSGITGSDLVTLKLPLPPLDEQRRIAAVLGALDDKIELNRKMNRTLEAIAQAIFNSWFIDFDGVPGCEMVDSELGPIPKGWEVRPLDAVANFLNGAACQKYPPEEGEDSLPVIKIRELKQGVTDRSDRATTDIPEKWIVDDGDVLFSWSGSLAVSIWTGGKGVLNQHLFKLTSEEYPRWVCLLWTRFHLQRFQEIAADKATTMGHIKRRHLTEALCAVPPLPTLELQSDVLAPLVQRLVANDVEARTLARFRDSLLPKLISGEIRVPEAEDLVEDIA